MAHERDQLISRLKVARRVHVIGGSGAGKTVLADRLGAALRLPVHHLDDVALDAQSGGYRPTADRLRAAREISIRDRWLSEGIYLGWTSDLLRSADVILWLDTVSGRSATTRIVGRFIASAVATARERRGIERFAHFRDYVRHSRGLITALMETRHYHRHRTRARDPLEDSSPSRAATEAELRRYRSKTLRLGADDVASLVEEVAR